MSRRLNGMSDRLAHSRNWSRVADNVVRDGAVIDADSTDDRVQGVRAFLEQIGHGPRLDATALQTVGSKGWVVLVLALVR